MPRRQLTVAELKLRTTWSKLSRAEQLRRLADEGVFTPGMPDIPPSLCPELEAQFREVAKGLAAKGRLAISDGDLIMQYLAMLEVKNFEEARRIETYLLSRDLGPAS